MNLRNVESYDVGLDIGTGSVGWSVLDEAGDLCRFKGKPTWGSRVFPSAETAADTRVHRGQRRRYDRRRQRLDLLQGFFAEEMTKVDPEFFIRLNQARLFPEDREPAHADYRWPLFNGSDFTEADYYKRFPTIYHLRAHLMESGEKADIRLIYLALHNIVKHRGNFLHQDNPALSAKNANMEDAVEGLCRALEEWCEAHDIDCSCNAKALTEALGDASVRPAEKRERAEAALGVEKAYKKLAKAVSSAVVGYAADFSQVFFVEAEGSKFALSNDEKVEAYACPDEGRDLFEAMQKVYSSYVLMGILSEAQGETLSFCKMGEYERYRRELETLKSLVRAYGPERYDEFFRGPLYEGTRDYDPDKAQGYTKYNLGASKLSHEDFLKQVQKLLAAIGAAADERYAGVERAIEAGTFLRRLKTSDNGTIPYQLHLEEMDAIIERQKAFYPFLAQEKDKLESLVTFRIPYYVGPLTQKNAARNAQEETRFAWSSRKPGMENARVYPWNWEDVIDKDQSAEDFIRRMTGTCTYLKGEPVLARCSLVYELFCVLNELAGARWTQDGDKSYRFDAEDRLGIVEDLFKKRKRVTYETVEKWLARTHGPEGGTSVGGAYHVSGGQGEDAFESQLSSHYDFCKILEVDELTEADEAMAEDIILWNTVFEDRSILKRKIKLAYGDRLSDGQIRRLCQKRYTGWGRLSGELLCGLRSATDDGPKTIMDILLEGDPNHARRMGAAMNLMEILHDDLLEFQAKIDERNRERALEAGGMSVDEVTGSPALRRGIKQALRIVDEIAGIAGKPPAHIYVEVTRDEDARNKGRRTTSRYKALEAALSSLKAQHADVYAELKERDPRALDDERLTLYFMQCGKCMYSGRALDINNLHLYHVDHILPQSYTKDDSFENKVLVFPDENERKLDTLLLDQKVIARMRGFWRSLRDAELIGEKKFNNLTRTSVSDDQMKKFVNRQLVETSQIVKQVQQLLQTSYPESEVQPVKASISHQLREQCGLVKSREVNDFHHAHDAYLACQVGRFVRYRHAAVYSEPVKMAAVVKQFIKKQAEDFRRTRQMPGSAGFIVSSFLTPGFDVETGEVFRDAWDAGAEIDRIKRCFDYKDCFISRMPEETHGAFWDATIYSPRAAGKTLNLPLKKGLDPHRYGSYSREQFAYFFVYEAVKPKKNQRVLEFAPVPVRVASALVSDPQALEEYARELAAASGLEFARIRRRKVYKYQQIIVGDSRLYITGKREVRNAQQFAFSQDETELIGRIERGEECSEEELLGMLRSLQAKYARFASRLGQMMQVADLEPSFVKTGEAERGQVLLSLVSIAAAHTNMIDLSAMGGSKCAGCMRVSFSKELSAGKVCFVDSSVTGMFERRETLGL
ncbi:type II CRISPR RNA-guided endonuclease Cas9 [Arabiibacter massiliensis]|uniref:type II CRISPR RNA-guided endonuclease Cas9 n=1 Tax=Arabiibacter massiliensis TaxID=1870985 RepID=UPI0009BA1F43|nr:type II CRISPR RNA-guided endonuclease Cas9 [Arabiibacter massiliensis]